MYAGRYRRCRSGADAAYRARARGFTRRGRRASGLKHSLGIGYDPPRKSLCLDQPTPAQPDARTPRPLPILHRRALIMDDSVDLKGIQEVADLLSVTPRTLRFYEEKGLIRPLRIGAVRVYRRCEIVRIRLVLRGRSMGFSLTETARFLDLYDADPRHPEQLRTLTGNIGHRIAELRQQREAIDQTLTELAALEDGALKRLHSPAAERCAPTSSAVAMDGADPGPPLPTASSATHEGEKIGVDDVRMRRGHAVR